MKKKNKVLATSVATIALCASLVAGGTYALFTSESEVNIAVTSGTVDVRATAGALTLYSNNEKQTGNAFANGGTATKVENEISIDRMTPMDSVNFDVKIENYSDVKVQYRTVIKAVDDTGLFEALDVTFTENNESQTFAGGIAYADWATLDAGDNNPNTPEDVSTINVNIEFPNGDNQNVYQGKSCKLAVVVEAVQANADVVNPITYENGIYYVNSEEGMMLMKGIIDSNPHGEGRELNFKLTANMDMTGYDWNVPNAGFTNIDGDNYTVSNLVCGQTERGWSGFLGYFGGGTLKNITLENVTAIGSQAGVIAGHADGGCIENVTIKGANTVAYEENAVETWGGVGALLGVSTRGLKASSNITVASGATISVAYNDILTESAYANEYAFIKDIGAYVTNNGTISTTGTWGIYLADGLYQMADGTYKITNANGLVTAGASYFSKGGTFNLVNSVTLSDELWIPAKVGKNFTFNGNGNTISNLNVADPAGSTNGMGAYSFLLCADDVADDTTTVKNVIFDGAKITGNGADNANMAVVLTTTRQHYDSTLVMEDVTVQNSVLKNGDRTGGLLAYGDSKATITMTNCASNNNTIESKGTAGALIAFTNFATTTINGFEAKNNTISSSEGAGKAGIVIGTASGATTVTVNDLDAAIAGSKAINAGEETNNVAGRMASTDTIKSTMTINGTKITTVEEDVNLKEVFTEDLLNKENIMIKLGEANLTWETGGEHGSTPFGNENTKSVTIMGESPEVSTLTATGAGVGPIRVDGGTLIVKNVEIIDKTESYAENSWELGYLEIGDKNTDTLVFENCVFNKAIQITGDATFKNCKFNSNADSEYAVWVCGGNAEFESCEFTGPRGLKMHEAYGTEIESVTVNLCKFEDLAKKPGVAIGTLNADTAVTIQNSEFIDCQPGDQSLYVYESDTDVTTFTFVNKNNAVINSSAVVEATNNETLDEAIKGNKSVLQLGSGEYIIPDSAQGKELTIIGNGETKVAVQDDGSNEGCDYSFRGATVTFKNITINTDSSTYTGYAGLKAVYINCTFNGTYTLYGDSVFNNCTFNVSGDVYNIWTWGAPTVEFNNCTFNSDGKALLLYGTVDTKLTVNNCVFNDNGGLTDLKAAIEIGNDYGKSYTLTVNNTTVNGYEINDKGINTGSTLWANKNSMGTDKLNVVIDGVDVY